MLASRHCRYKLEILGKVIFILVKDYDKSWFPYDESLLWICIHLIEVMSYTWRYTQLFHGTIEGVNVILKSVDGIQVLHKENGFGTTYSTNEAIESDQLSLSFEEAYFLTYALGCLTVSCQSEELDLVQQWNHFCNERSMFPSRYVCYQHFRAKGWVLKEGLRYGVDFLLYRMGPNHSHAEYAVMTVPTSKNSDLSTCWRELAGTGRLLHSVAKAMLLGCVTLPDKQGHPFCLKDARVTEVLFTKWGSVKEDLDGDADSTW